MHIGTIRMMINSPFREGIDMLINIVIMDNRTNGTRDATLGIFQGNLNHKKLIFNIYSKKE